MGQEGVEWWSGGYRQPRYIQRITQNLIWSLSVVYAKCNRIERRELWREMGSFRGLCEGPWVVCGDFNVIRYPAERSDILQKDQIATESQMQWLNFLLVLMIWNCYTLLYLEGYIPGERGIIFLVHLESTDFYSAQNGKKNSCKLNNLFCQDWDQIIT